MSMIDWAVPSFDGIVTIPSSPHQARYGGSGGVGRRMVDAPVSKRMSGTEEELYAASDDAERKASRHGRRAAGGLGVAAIGSGALQVGVESGGAGGKKLAIGGGLAALGGLGYTMRHAIGHSKATRRHVGSNNELALRAYEQQLGRKIEIDPRTARRLGFDVKKRDGKRSAQYAAGAAGSVGAGYAGSQIAVHRIGTHMQRGNQAASGDHVQGLRAKYTSHGDMRAEDMKFANNHWNKARRSALHGRLALVAGGVGGAGMGAAALHHATSRNVKKSSTGDLYRQASELDREGKRAAKAEAATVPERARRKPRGVNWDPESGRQRRVGALAAGGILGGGLLAASGVRGGLRSGGAARRVLAGAVKPSGPKANNQLLDADDVAHVRRLTSGRLRPVVISAQDAGKIVGGASLVGAGVGTAQYGRSKSNRRWN